jgi:hypothetical protein
MFTMAMHIDHNPLTPRPAVEATARQQTDRGLRIAALSGAASVVAGITGLTIAETETDGVTPHSSATFLVETYGAQTGELRTGAILTALAAVLGLVFLGPVWVRLKRAGEWQAMVAVAGGLMLAMYWLAASLQHAALVTFAEYSSGEAVRHALLGGWDTWQFIVVPVIAMTLGCAFAALPGWFRLASLFALAAAVIALVPGLDPWLPVMGACAWLTTLSLLVAVGPGQPVGRPVTS